LFARNSASNGDIDPDADLVGLNLTDNTNTDPQLLNNPSLELVDDLRLAPDLADNGGFVETYRLLADSPAIDAGAAPNSNQVFLDATGAVRITADIGAYEFRQGGVNDGPTVILNQGLVFTADTNTPAQIPLTSETQATW